MDVLPGSRVARAYMRLLKWKSPGMEHVSVMWLEPDFEGLVWVHLSASPWLTKVKTYPGGLSWSQMMALTKATRHICVDGPNGGNSSVRRWWWLPRLVTCISVVRTKVPGVPWALTPAGLYRKLRGTQRS